MHVGWMEPWRATLSAGGCSEGGERDNRGVTALATGHGAWCMQRIGGMRGDTMEANTEVCEARVFVVLSGLGEG